MLSPQILFFGKVTNQVEDIFKAVANFFEVIVMNDVPLTKHQLQKSAKSSLAIILHDTPEVNGFLKLKDLNILLPELPIIFLSPNPTREEIVEAMRMGVADVFILPASPDELISCIYKNQKKIENNWFKRFWKKWESKFLRFTGRVKSMDRKTFAQSQNNTLNSTLLIPIPNRTETKNIIKVKMLGEFEMKWNGKILKKIKSKKAIAIFAFLLLNHKKRIHKHILMNTFWKDSSRDSAKNCMHVTIHSIRKYLSEMMPGYDLIIYQDDCYSIHPDFEVALDTTKFIENWKAGKRLEQINNLNESTEYFQKAYALYQNDFLFEIRNVNWVEAERDNFQETFLVILERLSLHFFNQTNYSLAIRLCKDALKKDSCLEGIHRRLMLCYKNLGMRDKAIRQFRKCELNLENELDMKPSEKTLGLLNEIRN